MRDVNQAHSTQHEIPPLASDSLPEGHAVHNVNAAASAYWLMRHSTHVPESVAPAVAEVEPAGQDQTLAPHLSCIQPAEPQKQTRNLQRRRRRLHCIYQRCNQCTRPCQRQQQLSSTFPRRNSGTSRQTQHLQLHCTCLQRRLSLRERRIDQ